MARYGLALALAAAAWLVRSLLDPVLGHVAPFALFTVAILGSARYGGFGPALLATALGAVGGTYFLRRAGPTSVTNEATVLVFFLGIGFLISRLGATLTAAARTSKTSVLRLHEKESELAQEAAELARTEHELEHMRKLQELSKRYLTIGGEPVLFQEILEATVSLLHADMGLVQLYDARDGSLEMVAQVGFESQLLDRYRSIPAPACAICPCTVALKERRQVIVEDVAAARDLGGLRAVSTEAGFRAVQSTLLVGRDEEILGVLSTHFRQPHRPLDFELRLLDLYARQAAELIAFTRREAERTRLVMAAELIHAHEQERRRLSQELHDDFGQRLAVLSMSLSQLQQGRSGSLAEELQAVAQDVKELSRDMRRLAYQLHPAVLDDLGLRIALGNYVKEFSQRQGIEVEFTCWSLPDDIPSQIALCFYRVTQEALQNVVKHARAESAEVRLWAEDGDLSLLVQDRGVGFDSNASHRGRLGLLTMQERVLSVQGSFQVTSAAGEGTTITIRVPLPRRMLQFTAPGL